MKQILLLFSLLVPFFLFGQDLNGRWIGLDTHEINGQMFSFNKEVIIKQDGKKISGKMLVLEVGTKNHFIIQISGTIKDGKVKIFTDKVLKVDYPETSWDFLCFRNFMGELIVDEINNLLIMDLKDYGTSLIYDLHNKTYSDGNCHPTFTKLTKQYREEDNQSLLAKDSVLPLITSKDTIILIDKKEIKLFRKTIKMRVWDRFEEDGDLINLYLNGKILFSNVEVTKKGEIFEVELLSGINIIEVEAINEGKVSPNTSTIRVFTNNLQYDINLNSKKGVKDYLKIILD